MPPPYPHLSVLCNEWIAALEQSYLKTYLDGTLGAGGHAEAVLEHHPEIQLLVGIDQDLSALAISRERLSPWEGKLHFCHDNFKNLKHLLPNLPANRFDGMLFDIGVSSMQFDQAERGFSFMHDGPLDMRMNREGFLTAEIIVNEWSFEELGKILRNYGEEPLWRMIAKTIVKGREQQRIVSTKQLSELLLPSFPYYVKKKSIHPLTLTFQALRIAVNEELHSLTELIPAAIDALAPKGMLGIISFHSLEDRIVKNAFRYAASDKETTSGIAGVFQDKQPIVKLLTTKPITASEEELALNPRSRSAKLRIVQKL